MTSEKPYYIIGTAGHIDHGKTSLIKALTGIETDRLKEEKERGITIDLGFAYFNGPDGRRYGIVDVPGHERFIPNMLAGAYGFDVVLMVVAADDGVKPQTIEHFEILHLLRVPRAMFVITKIDLANPERVDDVREEIEILTHDSHLANSKIIPASNITGEGLKEVSDEISHLVSEILPTVEHPYFRFPIDRAFTITGFGTVVTGTIISGTVNIDDELKIVPLNKTVRVRNIEVHDEKVRTAGDGQRAAINLAKIEKDEIERGMELVSSELGSEMHNRYYADLEMLSHRYCNLRNFSRVRLFKGTMETMAAIINIEGDYFKPKGKYITQVNLMENSLIIPNERFIIRDETNKYTMGGGEFILPATIRRTRITNDEISYLRKFSSDNLASKIITALSFDKRLFVSVASVSKMFNLLESEILVSVGQRKDEIALLEMRGKTLASKSRLKKSKDLVISQIEEFHRNNPELPGIDKKDLREKLHNDFNTESEMEMVWEILVSESQIRDIGEFLQIKDFKIQLKGEDADLKKKIHDIYSDLSGNTPKKERLPELLKVEEEKINRIFQGLLKSRELIQLDTGVYITSDSFLKAETKAVDAIKKKGELTVADFRDILGTNRNMAVMLLEFMDNKGITIRKGNSRILKKR